ncbi:TPA: cupin domain-containing protein, partial [Citrobacter freundii]
MDVLSEILDKVELTSSYWYRTSFAGDWGISLPQEENLARFHIVTHGEFWYEVPKLKLKALAEQGDILIFFKGMEHTMASAPKIKAEPAVEFRAKANLTEAQVLEYGDQSKLKANVVCGHFCFNGGPDHPFLNSLPNV